MMPLLCRAREVVDPFSSESAQASELRHATCWKGLPEFSTHRLQCGGALTFPLGHPGSVARHLQRVEQEQQVLLDRIHPCLICNRHGCCCCGTTNCGLSTLQQLRFARAHDAELWQCLSNITRVPAFWASWSDCFPMIQARNPDVAAALVNELEGFPLTPVLREAASTAREFFFGGSSRVRTALVESLGSRGKATRPTRRV